MKIFSVFTVYQLTDLSPTMLIKALRHHLDYRKYIFWASASHTQIYFLICCAWQIARRQTYPTVVIVTNAHQIPSREPRQKLCGNSFGLDLKSYRHQQIANMLRVYQCVKIVKTTTINFLAQGGINVNIKRSLHKCFLQSLIHFWKETTYLLMVGVIWRVLIRNASQFSAWWKL